MARLVKETVLLVVSFVAFGLFLIFIGLSALYLAAYVRTL